MLLQGKKAIFTDLRMWMDAEIVLSVIFFLHYEEEYGRILALSGRWHCFVFLQRVFQDGMGLWDTSSVGRALDF